MRRVLTRTSEAKGHYRPYDSSAAYRFEVPKRARGKWCRNFKSAALLAGASVEEERNAERDRRRRESSTDAAEEMQRLQFLVEHQRHHQDTPAIAPRAQLAVRTGRTGAVGQRNLRSCDSDIQRANGKLGLD